MTQFQARAKFRRLEGQGLKPNYLRIEDFQGQIAVLIRRDRDVLFRHPDNYRPKIDESDKGYGSKLGQPGYRRQAFNTEFDTPFEV